MSIPKILVIEDDPGSMQLFNRVLTHAEYEVYKAATIPEARELLMTHQFDMILADMQVGSERTVDLLNEVGAALQENGTGIVAVSAQEQYRAVCQELGIDFFMSKPISVTALIKLVDRITVGEYKRTVPLILDTAEMMRYNEDDGL